MSQLQTQRLAQVTLPKGVLWGLGGYTAFFVAPAIGLPPEIPGIQAAGLEARQLWWVISVLSVGLGLLILAFARLPYKLLGVISIIIPYLINIPHHQGAAFVHPDPAAVTTLTALHQQFIIASAATNALFWILLGVLSAWLLNRWVLAETQQETVSHAATHS